MVQSETMSITFKLPYSIEKEGKWYVASCPILDVHSQGTSQKKAKENLEEAVSLFLVTCFEMGTLESVLKESGIKPGAKVKSASKTGKYIEVPVPFILIPTIGIV